MQPMWLCMHWSKCTEVTFEKTQWKKVKQMQPMWLCFFSGKRFDTTFENSQWRKIKQMQPMRICLLCSKQFAETFENTRWRQSYSNATSVTLHLPIGGICGPMWKYMVKKSQTNAISTLHLLVQTIWGDIWKRTMQKSKRMHPMKNSCKNLGSRF